MGENTDLFVVTAECMRHGGCRGQGGLLRGWVRRPAEHLEKSKTPGCYRRGGLGGPQ